MILAAACGGPPPPFATAADAERANVALAELTRGRELVMSKCSACHRPPAPAEQRASEWPRWITEMHDRSKLDRQQHRLIVQYMVVMTEALHPAKQ
ncbi:MAG: hypothetical protein ABI867_36360 [Kofleriaceae bacterium]